MSLLYIALIFGSMLFGAMGFAAVVVVVKAYQIVMDEASRKRQTQNTDAGILDTMSDITKIDINLSEIRARLDTVDIEIMAARKRLGMVRSDPYAYPKNGRMEVEDD